MTDADRISLVQGQLEAYNRHDVDLFCSFYHDNIEIFRINKLNQLSDFKSHDILTGITKFREVYLNLFNEFPQIHCQLKSRIILKDCIIDEEEVYKSKNDDILHAVAIYKFKDNKIQQVWFAR